MARGDQRERDRAKKQKELAKRAGPPSKVSIEARLLCVRAELAGGNCLDEWGGCVLRRDGVTTDGRRVCTSLLFVFD